jgi:hypothetical protein
MGRENIAKHLVSACALAVLLYFATFYSIEHLRTRKGGWQVTFQSDANRAPSVAVSQPQLNIDNVRFAFPDQQIAQSNMNRTITFDQPITNVPFGRVIYFDTTFLPGSIVLGLYGHEIQLLPRVLLVDNKEIPWQSGTTLQLPAKTKPASPPRP